MRCVMATDNTLHMPGQNSQCENHGRYPVPSRELDEYLVGAKLCMKHVRYLLSTEKGETMNNAALWVKTFKQFSVEKGHITTLLQAIYRKQGIESELS